MEFFKGKKLKHQPPNLNYVLRFMLWSEKANKLRENRSELRNWCDDNFGLAESKIHYNFFGQQYITYNYTWIHLHGTKYGYFCFKTKDDATKFKLIWG
jgi:hypothetical protein